MSEIVAGIDTSAGDVEGFATASLAGPPEELSLFAAAAVTLAVMTIATNTNGNTRTQMKRVLIQVTTIAPLVQSQKRTLQDDAL
jgi:hypothetical protein